MPTGWSCWNTWPRAGAPWAVRTVRIERRQYVPASAAPAPRRPGATRHDGKRVLYRLGDGPHRRAAGRPGACAEHQHAEMREVIADSIHQRERLDGVSITELVGMLKAESVTLLDVRPAEEFALGHARRAQHPRRGTGAPPGRPAGRRAEIVAYCRGPCCVLSSEAVTALDGVSSWSMTAPVPRCRLRTRNQPVPDCGGFQRTDVFRRLPLHGRGRRGAIVARPAARRPGRRPAPSSGPFLRPPRGRPRAPVHPADLRHFVPVVVGEGRARQGAHVYRRIGAHVHQRVAHGLLQRRAFARRNPQYARRCGCSHSLSWGLPP